MVIDAQTLINTGLGVVLALAGWLGRELWDAVEKLREDIHKIETELPSNYVRKDEFTDAIKEIRDISRQIFDKIANLEQRKADK